MAVQVGFAAAGVLGPSSRGACGPLRSNHLPQFSS